MHGSRFALFIKDILFTLYMYINILGVFKFIVMDILGMILGLVYTTLLFAIVLVNMQVV